MKTIFRNTLKGSLLQSWIILSAFTLAASFLLLLVFILVENKHKTDRQLDELKAIAPVISRRVSSELLLGQHGFLAPVIQELSKRYDLPVIRVLPKKDGCSDKEVFHFCSETYRDYLVWIAPIPLVSEGPSLLIASKKPKLSGSLPWSLLVLEIIPILSLPFFGMWVQWRLLKRRFLIPMGDIVNGEGRVVSSSHWSFELRKLAQKLRRSLRERDNALKQAHVLQTRLMMGEFVDGLLHDIKNEVLSGILTVDAIHGVGDPKRDRIKTHLSRIREIIREHQSRIRDEKYEPKVGSAQGGANLGRVASVISAEYREVTRGLGIRLETDIPQAAFGTRLKVTESEFERVLRNLLDNAVEASAGYSGDICLSVNMSKNGPEIVIKDCGPGFSMLVLEKVRKGERITTKPLGEGVGLLSVSYLVSRSGGSLFIQDSCEHGVVGVRW